MTTTPTFELTVTRTIPAPCKEVFEAWLSPQALSRFMCPAEGMTVPKVEVDARVGGSFLIVMAAGDQEIPHRGEYQTIDRYDRLVFTWLSVHTTPGSLVTIDFQEKGPNETEVTLHHVGLPSEEQRRNHEGGWGAILQKLGTHLG
ncbi:MAG: SRPBCC domain-containing protein [Polyangiales bacterium]